MGRGGGQHALHSLSLAAIRSLEPGAGPPPSAHLQPCMTQCQRPQVLGQALGHWLCSCDRGASQGLVVGRP